MARRCRFRICCIVAAASVAVARASSARRRHTAAARAATAPSSDSWRAGGAVHGRITHLSRAVPLWWNGPSCCLAGVWFVNLVNFMDGLDWITVAEMVPVTRFHRGAWLVRAPSRDAGMSRRALCGALIGFAPFNKPVARLFLGDVGSLPIGLLVGWLLLATRRNRRACGRDPPAALSSGGRHHHVAAPPRPSREGVGGASQPFLPAGDRSTAFR